MCNISLHDGAREVSARNLAVLSFLFISLSYTSLMTSAIPTASFKISTSNASFFVDEVKGDVILFAGAPEQRILIGNTHEHTAMVALTSNDAVVHGNFSSTNVSTNYVKSTGFELTMSDPTLLPTDSANNDLASNLATDAHNLATIASNQAFPLGTPIWSSGDPNVVLRVEHAYPTVFTSNATFCGPLNASNAVYMTSNLTVSGVLAASNAAFSNATFANATSTGTTSMNSATFAGSVVSHGLTHTSNAAFFASNVSFLGATTFLGTATFSNDLTVYGNINAMALTYQHSNIVVYNNQEVRSNLAVTGELSTSNLSLTGNLTASNASLKSILRASGVDVTGAFTVNGLPMSSSDAAATLSNCGTESAPLAGGDVYLNTSLTSSAVIELATSDEPLHIALDRATLFDISQVGKKGSVVLVERSTVGRMLTLDSRIHFATEMNLMPTGFDATSLASTTLPPGFATTAAPASGGFAVDSIDYYIPKPGFAIGNYYRHFKCMPPEFDEVALTGATHVGIANVADYTLDVAGFLLHTHAPFYGPLQYLLTPSTPTPSTSINPTSGVLTVQRNTAFVDSAAVISIEGVAGVTRRTIAFDVKPWYAPVIIDAAPGMPAFQNTNAAAYVTPAPSMQHGADYTGSLTWSAVLTSLPAGTSIDSATGRLTIPRASVAYQGSVVLTATGPAPSHYTTSSTFSVNLVNYQTPSIAAISSPQVGSTGSAPFALIPQQTAGNVAGTLTWSLSPITLLNTTGVTFDTTTGALGVALRTAINVAEVTLTATGPSGLSVSRSFALSVTPWADPKFTTDYVTENHDTITSSYVLAGPTVQQASSLTGTLVWSVTPSSLSSYLNTASGALTFPLHSSFPTGNVTLTATGPSGETESDTFSLTIVPFATPVISSIGDLTAYTGPGVFSMAAAVQTAANTGAITWSLDSVPSGVSIGSTTGIIVISKDAVFAATNIVVRATGPVASIYGTTSFSLTAEQWCAPAIATIPDQTVDTSAGAFIITPVQTMSSVGRLIWNLGPNMLVVTPGVSIDNATGVVTFAQHTGVSYSEVMLSAEGPTGLYTLATFSLTTVPYATPVISTIFDATVYTGAAGDHVVATATSATPNIGTIAWSLGAGAPSGVSIGSATGVIKVSTGTSFSSTAITVVATTPYVTISGTKTFNLTAILATPASAPAFQPTTIPAWSGNNNTAALTYDASSLLVTTNNIGTPAWSMQPSNLTGVSINGSTGVITIAAGAYAVSQTFAVTMTNATGTATVNIPFTLTISDVNVLINVHANTLNGTSIAQWGPFSQPDTALQPILNNDNGFKYVSTQGGRSLHDITNRPFPKGGFTFALMFRLKEIPYDGLFVYFPEISHYWPGMFTEIALFELYYENNSVYCRMNDLTLGHYTNAIELPELYNWDIWHSIVVRASPGKCDIWTTSKTNAPDYSISSPSNYYGNDGDVYLCSGIGVNPYPISISGPAGGPTPDTISYEYIAGENLPHMDADYSSLLLAARPFTDAEVVQYINSLPTPPI